TSPRMRSVCNCSRSSALSSGASMAGSKVSVRHALCAMALSLKWHKEHYMSTDTSNIFPGKCVVYRWRHGQVRAFQDEAAAMIVRVRMGNVVSLIVFPAGDRDFMFFENVAPYSQETQTHCWRHNQDDTRIADLEDQVEALKENLADATAKLEAL